MHVYVFKISLWYIFFENITRYSCSLIPGFIRSIKHYLSTKIPNIFKITADQLHPLNDETVHSSQERLSWFSLRPAPHIGRVSQGVGLTIPLECQVGRALGVMHAHLGEKALTSDQATQPNNQPAEHSINLISHPVWQSSLPIYVCPVSSMKVKDISEQPRNRSVIGAVGCLWFGPQAIDDT